MLVKADRNAAVISLINAGVSFQEVARVFKLTKSRVYALNLGLNQRHCVVCKSVNDRKAIRHVCATCQAGIRLQHKIR